MVENESFGDGCSSSIATALKIVDPRCDVLVLMLGDQPGVGPTTVRTLLARTGQLGRAAERGRGRSIAAPAPRLHSGQLEVLKPAIDKGDNG